MADKPDTNADAFFDALKKAIDEDMARQNTDPNYDWSASAERPTIFAQDLDFVARNAKESFKGTMHYIGGGYSLFVTRGREGCQLVRDVENDTFELAYSFTERSFAALKRSTH